MYDYVDRSAASLGPGARIMLWAMRAWVRAVKQRQCPCHALTPGFERWDIAAALPHLSMTMAILNCEAVEPMQFRAPCHPTVNEDEALLLALLAIADHRPVKDALSMVVEQAAVPALAIALEGAATVLAQRGLRPTAPDPAGAIR